jgi:hypothetical protein
LLAQAGHDELAVEHVHLATHGFDIEFFHFVGKLGIRGYWSHPEGA